MHAISPCARGFPDEKVFASTLQPQGDSSTLCHRSVFAHIVSAVQIWLRARLRTILEEQCRILRQLILNENAPLLF